MVLYLRLQRVALRVASGYSGDGFFNEGVMQREPSCQIIDAFVPRQDVVVQALLLHTELVLLFGQLTCRTRPIAAHEENKIFPEPKNSDVIHFNARMQTQFVSAI